MSSASQGPGNGNSRKMFGTDVDAVEAGKRGAAASNPLQASRAAVDARAREIMAERGIGFVSARFKAFRELNPGAPPSASEQERLIRDGLREAAPEVIDVMIEVAKDKDHRDFGPTSRAVVDHAIGRAKQGVESPDEEDDTPLQNRPVGL